MEIANLIFVDSFKFNWLIIFLYFIGQDKQGSVVIALVVGVVALTIIIGVLVFKRRRPMIVKEQPSREIGIDNSAIGQDFGNENGNAHDIITNEKRL